MKLRILSGPDEGREVPLAGDAFVLGRADECDIPLPDAQASREHARLFVTAGTWYVEDLNSTNGVRVNHLRISARQQLQPGDEIRIGETEMRFFDEYAPAAGARRGPKDETMLVPPVSDDGSMYVSAGDSNEFEPTSLSRPGLATTARPGNKPLGPGPDPAIDEARAAPARAPVDGESHGVPTWAWLVVLLVLVGVGCWVWFGLLAEPGAHELDLVDEPALPSALGAPDAPTASDTQAIDAPPDNALPQDLSPDDQGQAGERETPPPSEQVEHDADDPGTEPPDPPTRADAERLAAQRMAAAGTAADYLWLASIPTDAVVYLNGEEMGQTPLFLHPLAEGEYNLRLELAGFEPFTRRLEVPNDGRRQLFELTQQPGTVWIRSKPSAAAVLLGRRLLGYTPLLLRDLQPGKYEVTVYAPLHEAFQGTLPVDPLRPVSLVARLQPTSAGFRVTTLPPGAEVRVDDVVRGQTVATAEGGTVSAPLDVTGFKPGEYRLQARYRGLAGDLRQVRLEAGQVQPLRLVVWVPNTRVLRRDGNVVDGMLLQRQPDGSLRLLTRDGQEITIPAGEIEQRSPIPFTLAKELHEGD